MIIIKCEDTKGNQFFSLCRDDLEDKLYESIRNNKLLDKMQVGGIMEEFLDRKGLVNNNNKYSYVICKYKNKKLNLFLTFKQLEYLSQLSSHIDIQTINIINIEKDLYDYVTNLQECRQDVAELFKMLETNDKENDVSLEKQLTSLMTKILEETITNIYNDNKLTKEEVFKLINDINNNVLEDFKKLNMEVPQSIKDTIYEETKSVIDKIYK